MAITKLRARKLIPNALRSTVSPGQGKEEFIVPSQVGLVGAGPILARDLFNAGKRFEREPYSTASGRTSPTSGYKDCSGFIYAAYLVATGRSMGGTVSTTIETWAVNNGGRYVDRQYAMTHPAVGCAIWGYGSKGHIEWSVGDGANTYGTPSDFRDPYARDVGYSSWSSNAWGEYFTFPGVVYDGQIPKPQPPPLVLEEEQEDEDELGTLVAWKANNDPKSEWHRGIVDESTGDFWHAWYDSGMPAGVNYEHLAGPNHPNSERRAVVTGVVKQLGVAGNPFRLDLFLTLDNSGRGVFHLWRPSNKDSWRFIDERT